MKRDITNSIFLGVCSGLAKSTGINVVVIRLLFLLCLIMGVGFPLIVYLILAVVMPPEK